MPDASGRIPPVALSVDPERWARIFGPEDSPDVARPGEWCDDCAAEAEERRVVGIDHRNCSTATECITCGSGWA